MSRPSARPLQTLCDARHTPHSTPRRPPFESCPHRAHFFFACPARRPARRPPPTTQTHKTHLPPSTHHTAPTPVPPCMPCLILTYPCCLSPAKAVLMASAARKALARKPKRPFAHPSRRPLMATPGEDGLAGMSVSFSPVVVGWPGRRRRVTPVFLSGRKRYAAFATLSDRPPAGRPSCRHLSIVCRPFPALDPVHRRPIHPNGPPCRTLHPIHPPITPKTTRCRPSNLAYMVSSSGHIAFQRNIPLIGRSPYRTYLPLRPDAATDRTQHHNFHPDRCQTATAVDRLLITVRG